MDTAGRPITRLEDKNVECTIIEVEKNTKVVEGKRKQDVSVEKELEKEQGTQAKERRA